MCTYKHTHMGVTAMLDTHRGRKSKTNTVSEYDIIVVIIIINNYAKNYRVSKVLYIKTYTYSFNHLVNTTQV